MTQLEPNLLVLARACQDASYLGIIFSGGFVYATNKKILVRTRMDYPKTMEGKIRRDDISDVDKVALYKIKELVSRYEKEGVRDNIDLTAVETMLSFVEVYNKYSKDKLSYIRMNDGLYGVQSLEYVIQYATQFDLFTAASAKLKTARVLIIHDRDTIILNTECKPDLSDTVYIDYRDCSIVFGEMNVPKLKAIITKKIDKSKEKDDTRELKRDLRIITDFTSIKR